jgi:hypothetical protein
MTKKLTTGLLTTIENGALQTIEDEFTDMGFGTGTTPPTAGDTDLEAEVVRVTLTDLESVANKRIFGFFLGSGSGNSNTISEVGVFNDPSAGDLQQRAVLGEPIAKTSDKELWVDVEVEGEAREV